MGIAYNVTSTSWLLDIVLNVYYNMHIVQFVISRGFVEFFLSRSVRKAGLLLPSVLFFFLNYDPA